VGGGFPRTDDAANRLIAFEFGFRPRVNDEEQSRPNEPNRMPTITVRLRVRF